MSDKDLTISIKAALDGVEEAIKTVQDLFKKGSEAAKAMSEMVGGDLSDSLKTVTVESEAAGAAIETAFNPLAVIAFAQAIVDASEKLTKFISDTFIYTDADKQAVEQIKQENKVLLELANRTKEANRQRQLLMAPSDSARDKLKLQFQIEDQGGSAQQLKQQLKELEAQHKQAVTDSQKQMVDYPDPLMAIGQIEQATQQMEEAAVKAKALEGQINALKHNIELAEAKEALDTAQTAKDQAREAEHAAEHAAILQQEALRKSIALNVAKLDGKKKVSDAVIQQEQQEVRSIVQQQQLGAEEELALHKHLVDKKFEADEQYLQAKLTQLKRDPGQNAQQIVAVNAQIEALRIQHNTQLLKLDADYDRQVEKNGQEAVKKAAANNKKWLADTRAAMEQRMQAVAEKDKADVQREEQAVEKKFVLGKISQEQEITQLADLKREELQIEINYLRDREKLYQNDTKALAKFEEQITRLEAQQKQIRAKAETDAIKARQQQYQKMFSSIESTFSSFTHNLLSGQQKFGQAWAKLVDDMAGKFIDSLEKMLMQSIQHHMMQLAVHTEEKESEVSADAAASAQSKGISLMDAMAKIHHSAAAAASRVYESKALLGPVIAGVLAGAAYAAVLAFGTMASAEGGQYLVPAPQLTMLHPQEMVLPAGLASRMRDVVEGRRGGGSGGVTVVVNHSVNAIDAESFQGAIRKHGNMIGNEIARVLRKKGFSPA